MASFAALVAIPAVLFAWTNIDDLLVLLGFFSDPQIRARHIVIGQYLGIAVLYAASVVVSLLSIVLPPAYIGLLGLAPIVMGVAKLHSLWRGTRTDGVERTTPTAVSLRASRNILTVAIATVANGGDNISVYAPLFASRPAVQVASAGVVFAIMTALWCLLGHWLVHHPSLGMPLRRHARSTLPFLLIGFGIWILYAAGTLSLLR